MIEVVFFFLMGKKEKKIKCIHCSQTVTLGVHPSADQIRRTIDFAKLGKYMYYICFRHV